MLLAVPLISVAGSATRPDLQPPNPSLAGSDYPIMHSRSDFTPLAGPTGPGRRLHTDEIQWKTIGPINGYAPLYSGPYPNGKRVIWVGGYDRVAKLDADTLDVLTSYAIGGNTYFGSEEIERHIANLDSIGDDKKMVDAAMKAFLPPFSKGAVSFYRMLDKANELYLPYRYADGSVAIRVTAIPILPIRRRRFN